MIKKTKTDEKPLVTRGQVENAVKALLGQLKASNKSGDVSLIDAAKKIEVQFSLGKVYTARTRFCLDLPHSVDEDVREVCLFVADLDKTDREYEKTVVHIQDLLKKKGVTTKISKIIPIKALRTDYCQPHNRRTLAKAYDLFLADRKITGLLPKLLGKIFYGREKTVPRKVHLDAVDLKQHLDREVNSPVCQLTGRGFSSHVQVAHNKMSDEEIIDNVMKTLEILADKVPGGRDNLKSVHVTSPNTKTIPMYYNHVDPAKVTLPELKKDEFMTVEDEVTTVEDGVVRVRADGYVEVIKHKRKLEDDEDDDEGEKKPKLEIEDEHVVEIKEEEDEVTKESGKKKGNKTKKGKKTKKKNNVDVKGSDDDEIEIKEEDVEDRKKKTKESKKGKKKKNNVEENSEEEIEIKGEDEKENTKKKTKKGKKKNNIVDIQENSDEEIEIKEEDDEDDEEDTKKEMKESKKGKKRGKSVDTQQDDDNVKRKKISKNSKDVKNEDVFVKEERADDIKAVSNQNKKGKKTGDKVKLETNTVQSSDKKGKKTDGKNHMGTNMGKVSNKKGSPNKTELQAKSNKKGKRKGKK